ncbi:unnamed protein product [Ranitomeya imitator]|uniref:phosphatidylinositol-3,5-bisphosphate 3-phosphatase n=1 Tax=Ranitomeya imitator TaxID=111125 RepID=A0ABN9MPW2_9NEOB|nr:unnamed protein product [Ranitomeya imitator]
MEASRNRFYEYYPNCEVAFMGMANIHSIRNSFQYLRAVCNQVPDPGNWLSALESTKWLQHLSVMLKAATVVANAVDREERPVLVHCSDGWDRTPQIVSLAKLLLDPYYRTLEGFQVLVETDWLDYGHKFGDRCGHQENAEDQNEQCPVFLQWLDCVHQLLHQFPCHFEFNHTFLVKLVQHTYSCLYGTFLSNNPCERETRNIYKRTCSVWSLLRTGNKNFHNLLYMPGGEMVLHPVCHVRALQLWTAVYIPASSPCMPIDDGMELYLSPASQGQDFNSRSLDRLPKTRSMDNLITACDNGGMLTRTSSDPNLNNHQVSLDPRCGNDEGSDTDCQGPLQQAADLKTKQEEAADDHNFDEGDKGNLPEVTEAHNNNVTRHGNSLLTDSPDLKYDSEKPDLENGLDIQEQTITISISDQDQQEGPTLTKPPCPNLAGDLYVNTSYRDLTKSIKMVKEACRTDRRAVPQLPRNEISFLASNWESLQGMMKSVPVGESGLRRHLSYEYSTRSLHSKHGRHPAGSRDAAKIPYNFPASMHCSGPSMRSFRGSIASHNRPRFFPLVCPSPAPLIYQDDDGLPIPSDVVQQRLRQMEASYKQEVELLRRQVWELQLQLEIRQYCAPPPEPEADYEDDFTCVKESDSSDMDDLYSDKSEDRLSEASWEPVDKKDTEVTRWVPDHMASHCFNCDTEFWLAKRRHHCRNCGNVFCAGCCHLKLPIPDQQLYDPVLVCNTCYDHIQVSRARELMSQQLKKPLTAASS